MLNMMSDPPTNSPLINICGNVGQLLHQRNKLTVRLIVRTTGGARIRLPPGLAICMLKILWLKFLHILSMFPCIFVPRTRAGTQQTQSCISTLVQVWTIFWFKHANQLQCLANHFLVSCISVHSKSIKWEHMDGKYNKYVLLLSRNDKCSL